MQSARQIAEAVSGSRRDFLRAVTGASASAATLFGFAPTVGTATPKGKRAVVVTFGGGARDQETFMPEGQENIPFLLNQLVPQATFFTQVINRGILGHYVATASLATGVYETFNNFAAVPPQYPTVFEYFRKDLKRPATDTWVVAPSNGFNRIGESGNRAYGGGLGAGVILPKRLLASALPKSSRDDLYDHLLRDNYETPMYTPQLKGGEAELHAMAELLKLSVSDFASHARSLASPDELSVYIAKQLMRQLAPSLLWVTLHDIDIAHSGTYSLYLEAIQRTDRLCAEIWKTIQSEPEYAGKTNLFILPDFGRDSDEDPGGNGFQHHRTGDALSRTTWMLVMGPGVRQNRVVDRPVQSTDLVPTLGTVLGFSPELAQGKSLNEIG
ncbi:MAG: hypothetical protein JO182_06655 [Acidobacteriaceae bacterium]|nr:hypothetical protein [Acidobacteriaceae bacterium]MBV9034157.1 hypothetical protein [Acidobacteriaceae bacterium]MBV9223603.1 hypothetical protein [Acidobacteriaceae bacterium]MBV9677130.1 hypothetical protein [Acidobacteriaceae bacterium]